LLAAGQQWSSQLIGHGQIQISVNFTTGAPYHAATVVNDYPEIGTFQDSTLDTTGVAYEIETGIDPNGSAPDISLTINADYLNPTAVDSFWFDPNPGSGSASVPTNQRDALGTFEHELGHALGIVGFLNLQTGDSSGEVTAFDKFVISTASGFFFTGPNAEA